MSKKKAGTHSKWRPVFYSIFYGTMVKIARKHGYALALHGSMTRDMDVIAIPWTENASPPLKVAEEISARVGIVAKGNAELHMGKHPHGRITYTIPTGEGGWLDLGFMPRRRKVS